MMTSFFVQRGLSRDDGRWRRGRGVKEWRFLDDIIREQFNPLVTKNSMIRLEHFK